MYHCILVSLDGSRCSEAVLPEVEKLLEYHPGTVILLRAGPPVDLDSVAHEMNPEVENAAQLCSDEYDLLNTASEQEIRHYLEAIATRLQETGAKTIVEVSFSKPEDEIIFFARHYHADLIAMATHCRSGFNRLLHHSITESVLHRAPCPMLVVRTPETPEAPFGRLPTESERILDRVK